MRNSEIFTKVLILFLLPIIFSIPNYAQKNKDIKKYEKQLLLTVGSEKYTFGDIKAIYNKNSTRNSASFENLNRDSVDSFLDLYSKYKVKVLGGKKQGLDKDSSIIEEVERNKHILAESFLNEEELINPAVKKYTEMRKVEKKIAIILCHYTPQGDTSEAYNKINNALKEISNGATFGYAAQKYSSDSVSAKDGGVMSVYVTGLSLQKEIEVAIYNLKVGEYTKQPIKTGYGYFF
jgi:peptidyl-prolyl cis-trans isomerase SurA